MQLGLILFIVCLTLLSAWFGIPSLFRGWASQNLAKRVRDQRAIILTYDDGPSEALTPKLLDLLKRRGTHATFFLIGREAVNHPASVRRLLEEGHEIGNHTQDHLNAWKTGPLRAVQDMRSGEEQLGSMGADCQVFRPPFGKATLLTLLYNVTRGTRIAFWTHDSRDSWGRIPINRVLDQIAASGGAVLLMHDFDRPRRGPSPEQHQEYVLKLTESIIDFAETHDFKIVPFSALFDGRTLGPVKE